tara:strand:+ start:1517 stop:2416 length:900 start_codon:yes stop_codon:yes gene_type:complete
MTEENKMKEYTYQWQPEHYGDESKPILKITKSSFGSFQWCPKKYDFSYIQRLPQDTSEAMIKGTVVHNSREDFFDEFDVKKAEHMTHDELIQYNIGLHPIDDYGDIYKIISTFEAQRFVEAREANKIDQYIPVVNEKMLDAEIVIPFDANPNCILERDYVVHLQGIIDRMFLDEGSYVPIELKTGPWKDYKKTMMRKEMAFYKLLVDNATDESLEEAGIDRNIPITHWGWYYPVSNYVYIENVKTSSAKAVIRGITQLIKAYENKAFGGEEFPAKYYYKTCLHCSFHPICEKAQEEQWV